MSSPRLTVLGIAQDAGRPQAGCRKACCRGRKRLYAASLALRDGASTWIVDATPDFREQVRDLPAGILLTHGHVGHYTGLIHVGREGMAARGLAVFAMPRMRRFLSRHAPWEMLVRFGHIRLRPLAAGRRLRLTPRLSVTPLPVPHRAEYTETVAFRIEGSRRAALWLPDIDAWESWSTSLEEAIAAVDVAYLDGTFWDDDELGGRDIREIPHPRLGATIERLRFLPLSERRKVRFIHLNHTNPALSSRSQQARRLRSSGFRLAVERETVFL
jgi:pyrroloquinoline quinone biosynthesis protein B